MASETFAADGARLSSAVRAAWDGGGVIDLSLTPAEAVRGWTITVDLPGEIVNIWNARVVSRDGGRHVIQNADHNAVLARGETADFGMEVSGSPDLVPRWVRLLPDAPDAAPVASAPFAPVDADQAGDTPFSPADPPFAMERDPPFAMAEADRSLAAPPAPAIPRPGEGADAAAEERAAVALSVSSPRVVEAADGPGPFAPAFPPGFFSVDGPIIRDGAGEPVSLHGVNWFGLETETFAPHGLWARNWRSMMDEMRDLGFNAVRLPLSGELVLSDGGTPSGIDYGLNPDLHGLDGLQILDRIVEYADRIGLRVLLDYHRGPPGDGPNDNGLWYGDGFTEADWIDAWRILAARYRGEDAVMGADLANEPHGGTWGGGGPEDWPAAAARAADAILPVAPEWLMVVEGVATAGGAEYWWGGNLRGVADDPVRIPSDRLVYSAHDYPPSVFDQPWFRDGADLLGVFRENWGYIQEEGIAPVLIGEWGSKLVPADMPWAEAMVAYLSGDTDGDGTVDGPPFPWMWWAWNPNSGDTDGILLDDWTTVRQAAVDLLEPFLSETRPAPGLSAIAASAPAARFEIRLDAPRDTPLEVTFATVDGTALAGRDYVATAGRLAFAPGETVKTVSVPILSDGAAEGAERFDLVVSAQGERAGSGTATILEAGRGQRGQLGPLDGPLAVTVAAAGGAGATAALLAPSAPVADAADGAAPAASGTGTDAGHGPPAPAEADLAAAAADDGTARAPAAGSPGDARQPARSGDGARAEAGAPAGAGAAEAAPRTAREAPGFLDGAFAAFALLQAATGSARAADAPASAPALPGEAAGAAPAADGVPLAE